MNAGARATRSKFLLFLHADSALPRPNLLANGLTAIDRQAVRVAGHFALRFTGGAPEHAKFYRYLEGKTKLNRPHTINGDQGLLIPRVFFDELGGFDERLPFLEDQRIAQRIFERGRWILLPGELLTSARRFEAEGVRERYTLMTLIMGLYAGGADDFFARVDVYPPHAATGRLELRPYLDSIDRYLRELGLARRTQLLLRIGAFVRDNAWQLAYRRDVLRSDGELRSLRRFDRFIAPLLRNPAMSAVAALLARAWFAREVSCQ